MLATTGASLLVSLDQACWVPALLGFGAALGSIGTYSQIEEKLGTYNQARAPRFEQRP